MLDAKDLDFAGRRVLITGAAGGIGAAMAAAFAARGAGLVLADLDGPAVEAVAGRFEGAAEWHAYDQGDPASLAALAAAAGAVDVLVNNAGIVLAAPLLEHQASDIGRVVQVNLTGPMTLACLVAPAMIAGGGGVIVNTASQLAFCGAAERGAYAAAKAGLVQFTKTAAAEWAAHGLRVVALAPGRTLTPLTAPLLATPEQYQAGLAHIPMGRYGTAEEMAGLAVFLASDAAAYVTGATLVADGGYVVA